jgi:hypothetical protein
MDNISNEKMQIENTSPPQKPIKEKWIEMPIRSSVEAMRYIYGGFILNAIIYIRICFRFNHPRSVPGRLN